LVNRLLPESYKVTLNDCRVPATASVMPWPLITVYLASAVLT